MATPQEQFELLFVHKGEDNDAAPQDWAWTIRGSFPIEVWAWISRQLEGKQGLIDALNDCRRHIPMMRAETCTNEDRSRCIQGAIDAVAKAS